MSVLDASRGADEVGGFPLLSGRLGEHGHGGLGADEPDLVAGQAGQVLQEAAEAAVGRPAASRGPGALACAWAERWAGAVGLSRSGRFSSVKVSGAQALRTAHLRQTARSTGLDGVS